MTPIVQIILTLLQTIASVAAGTTSNKNVTMLLGLVTDAIQLGNAAYGALVSLNTDITAMVAAKADPTQDQWNALKARSDKAHATIQGTGGASSVT